MFRRVVALIVCVAFISTNLQYSYAQGFNIKQLPAAGSLVTSSPNFIPLTLKGLVLHPENALKFDFLMDTGNSQLKGESLNEEALKVMKYFLTALTMPEEDMWVNLSPYEQGKVIENNFGNTVMGRDLLAEDYVLKQLTASLVYPEKDLGKKFWNELYGKISQQELADIALDSFNKVWIVPSEAVVWEHDGKVMIIKSHLRVMLDEDYVALKNNSNNGEPADAKHTLASQIVRNVILPVLEKQVNEGEHFAQLRQMYQAMILATWYKKALKESILTKVYADQKKIKGVDNANPTDIEAIYQQYLDAFKKGAFNYIKEDIDQTTGDVIPRKYFSGGFTLKMGIVTLATALMIWSGQPTQAQDADINQALGNKVGDTVLVQGFAAEADGKGQPILLAQAVGQGDGTQTRTQKAIQQTVDKEKILGMLELTANGGFDKDMFLDEMVNKGEPAVPVLIEALKNEDHKVFLVAYEALVKIGNPAIPYLHNTLSDPDLRYVSSAILGEMHVNWWQRIPNSAQWVLMILASGLGLLGAYGYSKSSLHKRRAIQSLDAQKNIERIQRYLDDSDESIRKEAWEALLKWADDIDRKYQIANIGLSSRYTDSKRRAVEIIKKNKDKLSADRLASLLSTPLRDNMDYELYNSVSDALYILKDARSKFVYVFHPAVGYSEDVEWNIDRPTKSVWHGTEEYWEKVERSSNIQNGGSSFGGSTLKMGIIAIATALYVFHGQPVQAQQTEFNQAVEQKVGELGGKPILLAQATPQSNEAQSFIPDKAVDREKILWLLGHGDVLSVVKMGKPAVPVLIEVLGNPDWHIRRDAALALGLVGDKSAVPTLLDAFKDRNYEVHKGVAWALGQIGDRSAVPALIDALKISSLRENAAKILGQIGDKSAIPALQNALFFFDSNANDNTQIVLALDKLDASWWEKRSNFGQWLMILFAGGLGVIGGLGFMGYRKSDSYAIKQLNKLIKNMNKEEIRAYLSRSLFRDIDYMLYNMASDALYSFGDANANFVYKYREDKIEEEMMFNLDREIGSRITYHTYWEKAERVSTEPGKVEADRGLTLARERYRLLPAWVRKVVKEEKALEIFAKRSSLRLFVESGTQLREEGRRRSESKGQNSYDSGVTIITDTTQYERSFKQYYLEDFLLGVQYGDPRKLGSNSKEESAGFGGPSIDETFVSDWVVEKSRKDLMKEADYASIKVQGIQLINATSSGSNTLGGIALNSKMLDLQIRRDGNGVPLPVSQQPLDKIDIQGFVPQIINILPVNLVEFLSLNVQDEDKALAKI